MNILASTFGITNNDELALQWVRIVQRVPWKALKQRMPKYFAEKDRDFLCSDSYSLILDR
jgi:hypothetical protein